MKKAIALSLALTFVLFCVGCNTQTGNGETVGGTDEMTAEEVSGETAVTTDKATDITEEITSEEITEEKITEEITDENMTEKVNDETITEQDKTVSIEYPSVPEIAEAAPSLPSGAPMSNYVCGDGMSIDQYYINNEETFYSACAYYEAEGYTRYCYNKKGSSLSATYTKGDEYYTLLYISSAKELYVGYKENGAAELPAQTLEYENLIETTVTQGYSRQQNGMTYIFHLADDSFIIFDGGYATDAENLYNTLCSLAGRGSDFHIRAWFMTHAHGDHYPAFGAFGDSYADKVTLDCYLYSPIPEDVAGDNQYFTKDVLDDVKKYEGAKAVTVHAGMTFQFADVTVEVLYSPEYIYKDVAKPHFNNSSIVCNVKNSEGSMLLLADIQTDGGNMTPSDWLVATYGSALKSDMLQVSHHGVEQATIELYKLVDPSSAFWPCDESLLCNVRGKTTKQFLLGNPTIYEHLLHGYGNITRPLSHKAEPAETIDLLNGDFTFSKNTHVGNLTLENGVLKYAVKSSGDDADPYVYTKISDVSLKKYNALRLVVRTTDFNNSNVFITFGNMKANAFAASASKRLGDQGEGEDGTHTLIVYFGNIEGYEGNLNGLRIDIGAENGQVVEILSAELFYVDVD